MDEPSEAILALKPVTFRYKKEIDPEGIPQFGLVAEEVAKVNPDLVVRDEKGSIYTVRYEAVNAMLLNEFLKEHGRSSKSGARSEIGKRSRPAYGRSTEDKCPDGGEQQPQKIGDELAIMRSIIGLRQVKALQCSGLLCFSSYVLYRRT